MPNVIGSDGDHKTTKLKSHENDDDDSSIQNIYTCRIIHHRKWTRNIYKSFSLLQFISDLSMCTCVVDNNSKKRKNKKENHKPYTHMNIEHA